ncbi:histone-lysine N-methyltransferase SETMAR [Plakobranchus ocellatus]|uniref:Histone-lysine N-methyltransferase SETMAR n=1 Tax=Plakobranchus ocellatus TaxID=259542 RepID=A0AAV3Z4P3_9GAST|nr:histone-lysine N-methyltransferase SETMAR [Plakobranchus ocellatus]
MLPDTAALLTALKKQFVAKRPGLLRRGVVLQHDNATPHSANLTQQWLQRYGWEILPHPAHSPDLAPSDFHLFRPLKRHLGGMAFETEDDLISKLRNLDVDFFRGPGPYKSLYHGVPLSNLTMGRREEEEEEKEWKEEEEEKMEK